MEAVAVIGELNGVSIDLSECGVEVATFGYAAERDETRIWHYVELDNGELFFWNRNTGQWERSMYVKSNLKHERITVLTTYQPKTDNVDIW